MKKLKEPGRMMCSNVAAPAMTAALVNEAYLHHSLPWVQLCRKEVGECLEGQLEMVVQPLRLPSEVCWLLQGWLHDKKLQPEHLSAAAVVAADCKMLGLHGPELLKTLDYPA